MLIENWPLDESFTSTHFFVINFGTVESFNSVLTAILFPKNSPALWTNFSEAVFKESSPVSNYCFSYFLANDKNPYPYLVFGSIEYLHIAKLEEHVISI